MSANDRFKQKYTDLFGASLALSAVAMFLLFAYFPQITSADVSFSVDELQTVDLPPEVDIPPPPEAITRPATPVIGSADISDEITIPSTTFESNPVNDLPPPPTTGGAQMEEDIGKAPVFTPMTVRPRLVNIPEIQAALERNYPSLLRDAGIGGSVLVWFFIDEEGRVLNTDLRESSGYQAMDAAALKIAPMMRFTPAMNRDRKVKVWVSLPITFSTKG